MEWEPLVLNQEEALVLGGALDEQAVLARRGLLCVKRVDECVRLEQWASGPMGPVVLHQWRVTARVTMQQVHIADNGEHVAWISVGPQGARALSIVHGRSRPHTIPCHAFADASETPWRAPESALSIVGVAPNGHVMVVSHDNGVTLSLLRSSDGVVLHSFVVSADFSVFHVRGFLVAAGVARRGLCVFDVRTRNVVCDLRGLFADTVPPLFIVGGRPVVTVLFRHSGHIKLIDPQSGHLLRTIALGRQGRHYSFVDVSPDGAMLVVSGPKKTARLVCFE